jgi:hypothetical protein
MRPLLLLVTLIGACSLVSPLSPDERRELNAAEAKWRSRAFADYSYEIRVDCFCSPEITRWTRVSVRSGQVIDAQAVIADPQFPITTLSLWQPIDSLFVIVRRSAADNNSYLEDIDVVFDRVLGYPTRIELRAKSNVADGGALYSLRDVRPLVTIPQ